MSNDLLQKNNPPATSSEGMTHGTRRMLAETSDTFKWRRSFSILLWVLLLTLLGGLLWVVLPQFFNGSEPRNALIVKKREIASQLREIGWVSAHQERLVLSRFTGEIIWRAEDGTEVKAGDPVVMFDSKLLQEEIEQREKDIGDKVDAVARAEKGITLTRQKYEYLIRQKEIELQLAEMQKKLICDFPLPDDLKDVELTWKSEALDLNRAKIQTETNALLLQQGFISDAAFKKKKFEYATAKAEHARAKLIYDLTRQGNTPDKKRVADLAVADARKALNVAQFNREADLGTSQSALDLARIELAEFQRELARKKARLDAATVRAPISGRVIFQPVHKGSDRSRSPIQAGETRSEGVDLCTILDTSQLIVSLWINEMDISNISIGQRATIVLPALPEFNFQAVVSEIAVTAMDKNMALSTLALRRSGEAFVNVVKVKLAFIDLPDAVKSRIRAGFTADVRLKTGECPSALSVPWQAVGYTADGTPFADVLVGGKLERHVLKLGTSDNSFTEILAGLNEGMKVVDRSHAAIARQEQP